MTELDQINKVLEQFKSELESKYHVNSVGLFSSSVRDDFSSTSDIDIVVDFNRPIGIEFIDSKLY